MSQIRHISATGIDHINMTVRNLAESIKFYRELFGFEIRKEQPEWDSVIIGNDSIKLCMYEDSDLKISEGLNHFGFHIDNFGDIENRCRELNIPMPYGVVDWKGSKSIYITDPSGYEIELSDIRGGGL